MQTLTEYMKEHGQAHVEGHMQDYPQQVETVRRLIRENNVKSVMEIGFNAGHSCEVFLSSSPDIHVTSFDINMYPYTKIGADYIAKYYPGRHEFVAGNSLQTVPLYAMHHQDKKFDLIFVDGGHDYHTALGDLMNCQRLAHADTVVVMDDVVSRPELMQHWNEGPVRAWTEMVDKGLIIETGREDYMKGRGIAKGRFSPSSAPRSPCR